MTQDTFKAWRKAYNAGRRYANTEARQNGDGDSLNAYAVATYPNADERRLFIDGVYDQEQNNFYDENPGYTGNGWM